MFVGAVSAFLTMSMDEVILLVGTVAPIGGAVFVDAFAFLVVAYVVVVLVVPHFTGKIRVVIFVVIPFACGSLKP